MYRVCLLASTLKLERSTKTEPDRASNFMSLGPADSVPGPVVANGNEM